MRNFRRSFDKHPELAYVARRWATETYARLQRWAGESQEPAQKNSAST